MTSMDIDRVAAQHPTSVTQAAAVEQARAVAEVAAAVKVAQDNPRDLARAVGEMRDACGRMSLAQAAFYRVPNRGTGPSVHLARELARIWGNMQHGVHELRRDDASGMSEIQAFAWDVQANTRATRTFQVPHQRMREGRRVPLTDLGDVYLNNQNIGARAVRECVFTTLPRWFVEEAEELCRKTLRDGDGKPLDVRVRDMVAAFADGYRVKSSQIEEYLGRKRGQWDAGDVARMTIVYQSLSRGETTVAEEFGTDKSSLTEVAAPVGVTEPADTLPVDGGAA